MVSYLSLVVYLVVVLSVRYFAGGSLLWEMGKRG